MNGEFQHRMISTELWKSLRNLLANDVIKRLRRRFDRERLWLSGNRWPSRSFQASRTENPSVAIGRYSKTVDITARSGFDTLFFSNMDFATGEAGCPFSNRGVKSSIPCFVRYRRVQYDPRKIAALNIVLRGRTPGAPLEVTFPT